MSGPYIGTGWYNPQGGHHNTHILPPSWNPAALPGGGSERPVPQDIFEPKIVYCGSGLVLDDDFLKSTNIKSQIPQDLWRLLRGLSQSIRLYRDKLRRSQQPYSMEDELEEMIGTFPAPEEGFGRQVFNVLRNTYCQLKGQHLGVGATEVGNPVIAQLQLQHQS